MVLPDVIERVVSGSAATFFPDDVVIDELTHIAQENNGSYAMALFLLGFGSYKGFRK
jgi:hypothetical protein